MTFTVFRTRSSRPEWVMEIKDAYIMTGGVPLTAEKSLATAFSAHFTPASAGGGTTLVNVVFTPTCFFDIAAAIVQVDRRSAVNAFAEAMKLTFEEEKHEGGGE